MNIAAIIVTYFPNEASLNRLMRTMGDQVQRIYVVDNTPAGGADWLHQTWFDREGFDAGYVPLGDNLGIAKAQNIGVEEAEAAGCDHVIFFDQDSAPPAGMIASLLKAELKLLESGIKVGSVGPVFRDEKTQEYSPAIRHKGMRVTRVKIDPVAETAVVADYLISSGSLIRIEVMKEVGGMRDELFIDWVDIEWGMRAANYGYSHYMIPRVIMLHSIGDEFTSVGNRNINLHNDIRNYYIVRNACFLLREPSMRWPWRTSTFFKIPQYVVFYSFTALSKKRGRAFFLLLRACRDGFAGRLGKAF
jgi:rhamnosyltransferase